MEKETLFDKLFRDSNGNIVIAQPPNPPLILWGVASLLQLVFTTGLTNVALDLISFGSLFTWAWMELFQGQRERADRRRRLEGERPCIIFAEQ